MAGDTPDYQRGYVSPQQLLAAGVAPTNIVNVTEPVNAESLIVIMAGVFPNAKCAVTGLTTGCSYAGRQVANPPLTGTYSTWIFDVANAVDPTVQVNFPTVAPFNWWVYSDAAEHVTIDVSKYVNGSGVQYVIPTVPSNLQSDHPPLELSLASTILGANGTVIAAPGVNKRLRIFTLAMTSYAAGMVGYLGDSVSSTGLCSCVGLGNATVTLPGQGYPLSNNAALAYTLLGGAGNMVCTAYYTSETI